MSDGITDGYRYQREQEAKEQAAQQEMERKAREFLHKAYPKCMGFPGCDGELPGEHHSDKCPAKNGKPPKPAEILAAFAIHENAELLRQIKLMTEDGEKMIQELISLEAQLREKERELAAARTAAFREAAEIARNPQMWKKMAEKDKGFGNISVAGQAIAAELERIAEGAAPKGEEKP